MEQTAVNYLIQELFKVHDENFDFNPIFVKAIQMEKEQIMDAWINGALDTNAYVDFAEQYYNETFKQK